MATSIENVVVFGDSIAHGFGIPTRRSWVRMLTERFYEMNARNPHAVFTDLSCPGDGSARLQERVESELPKWVRPGRRHLSIVALGGQDVYESASTSGLPDRFTHPIPGQITRHVLPAARKLGEYGMTLVVGPVACRTNFAGLYGHDDLRGRDVEVNEGLRWVGHALWESFDMAAAANPAERYFLYADLLHASMNDPEFTLGRDGIHPDADGQRWIYDRLVPYFDRLVQQVEHTCLAKPYDARITRSM